MLPLYSTLLEQSAANEEAALTTRLRALVDALSDMKGAIITFHVLFPDWRAMRETTLETLNNLGIGDLHSTQKKVDITKVTSSTVGILSGATTITGIALAPFTFGASLALTITGISVGVASTATGLTATGIKLTRERAMRKKFETIRENDVIQFERLQGCLEEIKQLDETIRELVEEIQADQAALRRLCGLHGGGLDSAFNTGRTAAGALGALRALGLLQIYDFVAQVAVGAGKLGSRVAGIVFSGLGIAIDFTDMVISARSIDTGSVNTTATKLAATIALMQNQLQNVIELHEHIKITRDDNVQELIAEAEEEAGGEVDVDDVIALIDDATN